MIKQRKVSITFNVEPEIVDYINRMAEAEHCTVSQYLRNLVWTGYEIEKDKNLTIKELSNGVKVNIGESF